MKENNSERVDKTIEQWVDDIIERTKDDKVKNPERCHKFFMESHRLYPSNNR